MDQAEGVALVVVGHARGRAGGRAGVRVGGAGVIRGDGQVRGGVGVGACAKVGAGGQMTAVAAHRLLLFLGLEVEGGPTVAEEGCNPHGEGNAQSSAEVRSVECRV